MPLDLASQSQLDHLAHRVSEIQAQSQKQCVVYTCITNDYSRLLPPPEALRQMADFILFSDTDFVVEGWTNIQLGIELSDPRRTAKIVKILPHKVFPSYDMSVWMDGNIRLEAALNDLVERFAADPAEVMLVRHRARDCLYDEARICIQWSKDAPDILKAQTAKYRSRGFPEHAGLFMGGFQVRKHNKGTVVQAMDFWWNEVDRHSVRDQISLPVALQQHEVRVLPIRYADHTAYFEILPHQKYATYSSRKFSLWYLKALATSFIYHFAMRRGKKRG